MKKDKNDHSNHDDLSNEIKIERGEETKSPGIDNDKKINEELNKAKSKIDQLEKDVSEYKDRLLRKAAEFENYKRRTENDQLNLLKYAAESFIIKLLPVVDDFERSLQHMENTKDVDSLKQGIKLVYDKFIKVLDGQGISTIESVGKPFNVQYHEAVLQKKADGVQPHTVLEEVEKGYLYKDRVIRHTKVIVSADNSEPVQDNSGSTPNSEEK
jgi:molecular chaperone GrpE